MVRQHHLKAEGLTFCLARFLRRSMFENASKDCADVSVQNILKSGGVIANESFPVQVYVFDFDLFLTIV